MELANGLEHLVLGILADVRWLLRARETVLTETPQYSATVLMVVMGHPPL